MILVTGGTGFIGQSLIRNLVNSGYAVRTLMRPSRRSPRLPLGVPVEVAVAGLNDARGLRAAMVGVDTVFHLVSGERRGGSTDLLSVDVRGTRNVIRAAEDAGVRRFFYISHLGADRASAYPVLKTKAIAEEYIRRARFDYTIFRTGLIFGDGDQFTTSLAQLLYGLPFIFLMPGSGDSLVHPLWVEDLTTCLTWALEDIDTRNRTFEIGGPEYISLHDLLQQIMRKIGARRTLVSVSPPLLRALTVFLEYFLPSSPVSVFWLDYLAFNRTCALDTIPRVFNLMPSRFSQQLEYLENQNWRMALLRSIFRRRKP